MASPPSPQAPMAWSPHGPRLKLHDSTSSIITSPTRTSILSSSTKGWSPLTITKNRDSSNSTVTSPILPNHTGGSTASSSSVAAPLGSSLGSSTTRRTSSSFRHMATNSLVAKSPFKDLKTREGALSNGLSLSTDSHVIHERRSAHRALGQAPKTAYGSASTPRTAIGLGHSTSTSRNFSPGSAVSGTRKVSNERKVSIPSSVDRREHRTERRQRRERKERERQERSSSGSKENETPPKRRPPRKSLAYRATVEGERVTKSPFRSDYPADDDTEGFSGELLASPSPRRVSSSNRRKASPSANLSSGRISMSPSASPQSSRATSATISATPIAEMPTPSKSALASARRLDGSQGMDSPSRKTVTFEPIPDVKEFDASSRDISLASIPHDDGNDEWVDDENANVAERSFDSEDTANTGDASATADFMDSLLEEGLFSGASQEEIAFDDEFEIPMESFTKYIEEGDHGDQTPMASTPLTETRKLPVPPSPQHAHVVNPQMPPTEQPPLPHSEDHNMLRNADASQPALPGSHMESPGPHAHQEGALYDPFITIQTATDVLVGNHNRVEDGVPLGRSSHAERVQAARMLATQKLGLGFPGHMPRTASPSPAHDASGSDNDSPIVQPKPLENDVFGAVVTSPASRNTSGGRKVSAATPEYQGPSKRMAQFRASKNNTPTKSTPRKLPPPLPVSLPSPVQMVAPGSESGSDMSDTEVVTASRAPMSLPMSLPAIGTSPLMTPAPSEDEVTDTEAPHAKALPPVPRARVSDVAPSLSLPSDIEESEPESTGVSSAPVTPRISSDPPHLALTSELEDVSHQLSSATINDDAGESGESTKEAGQFDDAGTDDEPLTPPPGHRPRVREDSPRIPSFEFDGGLGLGGSEEGHSPPPSPSPATPKPITIITAPSPSDGTPSRSRIGTPTTPRMGSPSPTASVYGAASRGPSPFGNESPTGTPTRNTPSRQSVPSPLAEVMSVETEVIEEETSIIASEFGVHNGDGFDDASTTTRIRQRISREMIRETVNQRVAAGGLSRPVSMFAGPRPSMIDAPRRRNVSPLRIQPRSPRIPMSASTGMLHQPRTPTSPTATAALQQLRDAKDSPKSALDRIMNQFGNDDDEVSPTELPQSPTKVVTPARVLRKEHETEEEYDIAPSLSGSIVNNEKYRAAARRVRRRSASTSEAANRMRSPRLTLGGIGTDTDSILSDMRDEIEHIGSQRGYRVRQRHNVRVTYTGNVEESAAGSLEIGGKACRPVRRPSDMNEHAKEIHEARAREVSEGKASGTIFVKVLGIEAVQLPLPSEPTNFCITLDNGIDYIRTPYNVLKEGAHVNQEFSLVEHKNFEFSLSLDVRRDPHVTKLIEERERYKTALAASKAALAASTATAKSTAQGTASSRLEPPRQPPPARPVSPAVSISSHASRGGFSLRSLFSSPRKNRHQRTQSTPAASLLAQSTSSVLPSIPARKPTAPQLPPVPKEPKESLGKYFTEAGGNTIAKTHIAFKPIAKQCEAKVLEIRYPMFAMYKAEGAKTRQQVAKITIQIVRLPPLPGLAPEALPGSIEETLRGLRHHQWHLHEYNEGVLTQLGGDCRVPRRRLFRLVGGNLLAVNEVTRKEVACINLKLAKRVTDLNAPGATDDDDFDPYSARPRSFRLKFADGESISFAADRDEDKAVWMDTFNGLIGRIPPNPLWAEMLVEQQAAAAIDDKDRRRSSRARTSAGGRVSSVTCATSPTSPTSPRKA